MDDLTKRLAALTPAQRALLELRRKQQGLSAPAAIAAASHAHRPESAVPAEQRAMDFSLFFFSDDGSTGRRDKYRLLLDSAAFADTHGFTAIWTPERHFQDFGGLYPNPSVLGAALAMITERLQIRAGSVVLPLHHPIRVAEEWAVVDNLSNGRVGMAVASGWHPGDFVLSPATYAQRKPIMFEYIELIRQLWAGEAIPVPGVDGEAVPTRILPRPLQASLPIWITSSGTPDTFEAAGAVGANILTAGGITRQAFDDLEQRIRIYRESLARHGHDPAAGTVSLMVHTFLGSDEAVVKEQVRAPLRSYLRTYLAQFEDLSAPLSEAHAEEQDLLLDTIFERYFERCALLGTPQKCAAFVDQLQAIGINELACLVDFGLDTETVLAGLPYLDELKTWYTHDLEATSSAEQGRQ